MANSEKVAAEDASWLHMDSADNLMVVTTMVRFEQRVAWDSVLEAFQTRVIERFPRFSQRIRGPRTGRGLLGGPQWEPDPDFRLEHHIQRHRAEGSDPDQALQEIIAAQAGMAFTSSRPRWRLHLVDEAQGRSALFLRSHHSLADGLGLVQVLLSLADRPADGDLHPQQLRLAGDPEHRTGGFWPGSGADRWGFAFDPAWVDIRRPHGLRAAAVYRKLSRLADQQNPWRGQLSGTKRYVWSAPTPLDDIKQVATSAGATVNDMGLAVISGAMHEYFAATGSIPAQVGATIPFNLRSLDQPLDPNIGNQLGLVFANLPVGVDDRRDRLEQLRQRMARIKASPEGEIVRAGMAMMGAIPRRSVAKAWLELFTRKSTVLVTNIVGPSARLAIAGTPIDSFVLWVPTSGQVAVGLSIVTYAGELRIGAQVDTAVVSDVDRFIALVNAELSQLDRYLPSA